MTDYLHEFALEAARFESWATEPHEFGAATAQQALVRIVRLYSAALCLPRDLTENIDDKPDWPHTETTESASVVVCNSIPLDMYAEIFNPLVIPPENPVIASLADDIIDIYRDVARGLRAYELGDLANAHWEWSFHFAHHWGEHATGAIRALHAWLTHDHPTS